MVSGRVLLVSVESAICVHPGVIMVGLMVMVMVLLRMRMCWLALVVAGQVEGLSVPPVALRLLQGLHGTRGPLAVIEGVAAASFVGLLVLVVPVAVPVTLARTLLRVLAPALDRRAWQRGSDLDQRSSHRFSRLKSISNLAFSLFFLYSFFGHL